MTPQADRDVVIIGAGVGGGATALRLARAGLSVLFLERGERLPREDDNWDVRSVFVEQKYQTKSERWRFDGGRPQHPAAYYYVGGASKFYAAIMARFRRRDFGVLEFEDGTSPAWPITYDDLEPYYGIAEGVFGVHGKLGDDETEPPHSTSYPFGPIGHEPAVQDLVDSLRRRGLKPYDLPVAIDRHPGGACIRCGTCDGYPCKICAKGDAETRLIDPALVHPNVSLLTGAEVERLVLDEATNRISEVRYRQGSRRAAVSAKVVVLSAGAINSAALLLKSSNDRFPRGLANSSGVVGRHYMAHNSTVVMGIGARRTRTVFQKTFGLNDFYFGDAAYPYPMGNVQMIGKIRGPMLAANAAFVPAPMRDAIAARSIDWFAQSEDLPHPDSRVSLDREGRICLDRKRTNQRPHQELLKRVRSIMRKSGYPIVLVHELGTRVTSHQCGTVRFGGDPRSSALDMFCRSHDHPNLFVIDGSFLVSSAAMNPTLTIAAQAFRAADHMLESDFGPCAAFSSRPSVENLS